MNRVVWVGLEHMASWLWPLAVGDGQAVFLGAGGDASVWRQALMEQAEASGVVARDCHDANLKTIVGQCRAADLIRQRGPLAHIVHCLPQWDTFDPEPGGSTTRDDVAALLSEVTEGVMTISRAALATLAPGGESSYTLLGQSTDSQCGPAGTAAEAFVRTWVESSQDTWRSSGLGLRYMTPRGWQASCLGGE